MRRILGFLGLFGLLGLFPLRAGALYPTDIIRLRESVDELSNVQREEQRARVRRYEHRPSELDARLRQKRPGVREKRVSQRTRRSRGDVFSTTESSRKRRSERMKVREMNRTPTTLEKLRADVLLAVNREREKIGVFPLKLNTTLQATAQAYAEDMNERNFFDHESPEGETTQQRIQRSGYGVVKPQTCNCRSFAAAFGENLAKGQQTVGDVIEDWMHSPQHKANILSERYAEMGVGIDGYVWVQHFGSVQIVPR